jgi:hypothetical protein
MIGSEKYLKTLDEAIERAADYAKNHHMGESVGEFFQRRELERHSKRRRAN